MSELFGSPYSSAFHDKAWRRADMAEWDTRWQRLALDARRAVLETVRTGPYQGGPRPVNSTNTLTPAILTELTREGFVESHPEGFLATEASIGFVNRIRSLRRFALLDGKQPSQFERYINQVFSSFDMGSVLASIIEKHTGIPRYRLVGDVFDQFVRRHFWPEWVADCLNDPLARPLLATIEMAGGPVPLTWLAQSLRDAPPTEVRATYDRLVNHLVLFEDVDGSTWDILTGFLPVVWSDRRKQRQKKPAKLEPVEAVHTGPEAGIDVPDLRAVLLEVSAARPRLKQDGSLYAKEKERFLKILDPLAAWMLNMKEEVAREHRLSQAVLTASQLELAKKVDGPDGVTLLELTDAGRRWLTLGREEQYELFFRDLREGTHSRQFPHASGDSAFLGVPITSIVRTQSPPSPSRRAPSVEARQPLRDAIYSLLTQLPVGQFFAYEQFNPWAGEMSRNPLLLGRSSQEVLIQIEGREMPPLEEPLAETCRMLLHGFLVYRLTGLGCVQMGCDSRGRRLFTRLPRFGAYFGREVERREESTVTRVIVQPDFSVVVIGLDPLPATELMPFCERVQGTASQGAMTFRISRESVYRGIAGGLKPDEIPQRLTRHATTGVPANVLTEVTDWCSQVRTVTSAHAILIRCPDAETASRVVGVLGKQSERVGESAVAYTGPLTPAVRQRLQAQGVMVETKKKSK